MESVACEQASLARACGKKMASEASRAWPGTKTRQGQACFAGRIFFHTFPYQGAWSRAIESAGKKATNRIKARENKKDKPWKAREKSTNRRKARENNKIISQPMPRTGKHANKGKQALERCASQS